MSDDHVEDQPMPLGRRIITGVVIAALVVLGAFMMIRMSSPAILPDQDPPGGHYTLSCAVCHPVSDTAKRIGVE